MPRRLHNWGNKDVLRFLREHDFYYYKPIDGSHEAWIKTIEGKDFVVEVNLIHGGDGYKQKTLKTMIEQSGIPEEEWIKWASQ